jgi:cytochrome c oxidase cbb3-type subunit I/II
MSPGSTMPHFRHLLTRDLDFDKVTDRVKAAHLLGAPYDRELTEAPDMARRQAEEVAAEIVKQGGPFKRGDTLVLNSQAVALIAYLQRLGVDLTRPAAPATEGAAPADGSAPATGAPAATAADDSPATAWLPLAASRADTDPEPR